MLHFALRWSNKLTFKLQRTGNKFAAKRRIYRRSDRQKYTLSRHTEFCKAGCTTWTLTLQDINMTPKEPKTERGRSHRQLFCHFLWLTWLRIFETVLSQYLSSWMKIVVCKCFTELYFFYWLLVVSLAILIAVPIVFSRTWTSLAGVLKMPRVTNALKTTHNKTIK